MSRRLVAATTHALGASGSLAVHPDPTRTVHQPRILIVDDDEVSRDIAGRVLREAGYATEVAGSGADALALLRGGTFELVLLDIQMPDMDGFAVLEQLKRDERHRDLPVIMASARNDVGTVMRCVDLGVDGYLLKPLDPALLLQRAGEAVRLRRTRVLAREQLRHPAGTAA